MSIIMCPLAPTSMDRPETLALTMSIVISLRLMTIPRYLAASWDSSPGQSFTGTWTISISPSVPLIHNG
eukprot:6611890-Heterocapsa_arctica.AAC.1